MFFSFKVIINNNYQTLDFHSTWHIESLNSIYLQHIIITYIDGIISIILFYNFSILFFLFFVFFILVFIQVLKTFNLCFSLMFCKFGTYFFSCHPCIFTCTYFRKESNCFSKITRIQNISCAFLPSFTFLVSALLSVAAITNYIRQFNLVNQNLLSTQNSLW